MAPLLQTLLLRAAMSRPPALSGTMTLRSFRDDNGLDWDVWDVYPTLTERRSQRERRTLPRATSERRVRVESRAPMPEDMKAGWLAFNSKLERRRRAPIPSEWESFSDQELRVVLKDATSAGQPRRLIE